MNIKIIGSGAIGSLFAGLLNTRQVDVCFANNPVWEKKRTAATLRLVLPGRWLKVEGICYDDTRKADMLFVCVKRHHLPVLKKEQLSESLSENSGNILFFNYSKTGINHLSPGNDFHPLFCVTLLSAVSLQPGDVELTSENSHIICEKNKVLKKILSLLKDFHIKLHMVDDISPYMNSYFIFQLLYLPVAMCNTTLLHFFSYREGRELAMRILHEGIKTFEKSGKPLQKLPSCDPLELLHQLEKKAEQFTSYRYKPDRTYNPLLQSLLLEKESEAKELNGELVTLAKDAGVDSSWNWRLLQKLPRVKRFGYYPTPSDLLKGI
ncbi:MAG: hypothetical protein JXB88_20150 [Spirochaetales bacterium]|nr:hypothetical protein [Spirochaetales bacterium]